MAVYYGSDSDTPHATCTNTKFYIGKLGENLTIGGGAYWRTSTASYINNSVAGGVVYGYWMLHGPKDPAASNYASYYAYGEAQAKQARMAWNSQLQATGDTIFADVEVSSLNVQKWDTSKTSTAYTHNRNVVNGFLDYLKAHAPGSMIGLYSSPCKWSSITGSIGWVPNDAPVTWTATYNYGANGSSVSCPSAFTAKAVSCLSTYKGPHAFGGITPTIWQYTTTSSGDYDSARSLPS